jgi:peroxiredoxin Q/BCP
MIPEVGQAAPPFDLPASSGEKISLKGLRGRNVLLYFYPKDDTPGCTVEACEFKAKHSAIEKTGTLLLGISPDGLGSHEKFIKKFDLPFELLADEGHQVAEAYGLWVEKNNFGRTYMGVQRASFLIDAKGILRKVWPKVHAEGHAAEVLEALKELKG